MLFVYEQGDKLADEIGAEKFIEISAKSGKNLKKVFESAVSIVLAARKAAGGSKDDTKAAKAGAKADDESDEGPQLKVVQRQAQTKRRGCVLL